MISDFVKGAEGLTVKHSVKDTGTRVLKVFSDYVAENRLWYVLVITAVVFGAAFGALSAAMLPDGKYEGLNSYLNSFISAYSLQSVSRAGVFRASLYGNLKLLIFIWLSGFWIGLIPFSVLNMGVRGYGTGFTAVFIVQAYRGKGVIFALLSLLPRTLILIPAAIIYTVFCIRYSISLKNMRRKGNTAVRRTMYARSAVCLLMAAAVFVICSLIEGFVVPTVLKPICSLML